MSGLMYLEGDTQMVAFSEIENQGADRTLIEPVAGGIYMYAGTDLKNAYALILKRIPYGEIYDFLEDTPGCPTP